MTRNFLYAPEKQMACKGMAISTSGRPKGYQGKKKSWKERCTKSINDLHQRAGSSLQAIKKDLDADREQWRFINAALKSGVADGTFTKNGGKYKTVKKPATKGKKKRAPTKKKMKAKRIVTKKKIKKKKLKVSKKTSKTKGRKKK